MTLIIFISRKAQVKKAPPTRKKQIAKVISSQSEKSDDESAAEMSPDLKATPDRSGQVGFL